MMKRMSARPPSPGAVLAALVYTVTTVFFLWGARQPDLDQVWFRFHELRTGKTDDLDKGDRSAFFQSFERHPDLAQGLLDGKDLGFLSRQTDGYMESERAWLLRTDGAPARSVRLVLQGALGIWPVSVRLRAYGIRGRTGERVLDFSGPGTETLDLPATIGPELLELRVLPRGTLPDHLPTLNAGLTVRLALEGGP